MRENVGFIIVAAKDFQDFEIVLYYTSHFLKAVEDYKDRIRKEEEYIC